MNILITIVLALLGITTLLLIIGLFSKKAYTIEREIIVKKAKQDTFKYIKLLKNQDNYSKWVMADRNMSKTFHGVDGTVGFVYVWDSQNKKVGKGELEIKQVAEGESVDMEIRFERPFKGVSQARLATEGTGEQTKVKWTFDSAMKYPMNIMMLFVNFEKLLGNDMEHSLGVLKNNLEK